MPISKSRLSYGIRCCRRATRPRSSSFKPGSQLGPAVEASHPKRREKCRSQDRTSLKASADPNGQIALKRSRCGEWHADRDSLDAPHGGRPRLAEAGERLHNDRDRPRLTIQREFGSRVGYQ